MFITGLPRTGTTKLQRVLAASGLFQNLPLWKIISPLADSTPDGGVERRIALAAQVVEQMKHAFPRFYAAHPMDPMEPDEEALLLEMSWKADPPCWRAHLPSYLSWLFGQSMESSYQWLKNVLQLVQWQDERSAPARPWVLKAPGHLGRTKEIFSVFPDAVVIHCHRDPVQALPSGAGLAEEMRRFYSDRVDAKAVGRFVMDLLSHDMDAYLDSRPRQEREGRHFIDVPFSDIASDDLGVCQAVCKKTGIAWTLAATEGVRAWSASNPPHKHGKFDYSLERYGMTEAEIREKFSGYIAKHL